MLPVGFATGLAMEVELRPVPGDHAYTKGDVPPDAVGAPPIVVELPLHIATGVPALAITDGQTVRRTVSLALQPLLSVTFWIELEI